jgi:hypothetical protein
LEFATAVFTYALMAVVEVVALCFALHARPTVIKDIAIPVSTLLLVVCLVAFGFLCLGWLVLGLGVYYD